MKFSPSKLKFTIVLLSFLSSTQSQDLQLSEIMKGDEFIGEQPQSAFWSHDSKDFFFEWNNTEEYKTYYSCQLGSSKPLAIKKEELHTYNVNGYYSSPNGEVIISKHGASIFQIENGKPTQLFKYFRPYQVHAIQNNGDIILFMDNNLFLIQKESGAFVQVTNFLEGSKPETSNTENYLEHQQRELFKTVKKRENTQNERKQFKEASAYPEIEKIYLNGWILDWIEINESYNSIAYELTKYPKNEKTNYTSFINESGHTKAQLARPKVGAKNPKHLMYIYSFETKERKLIETEKLNGILRQPEYLAKYNDGKISVLEKPKPVIYHEHGFSEDGNSILIEIKSYDNKDRWICHLNLIGELIEIDHQHDQTWIGGPGISGWNMVPGTAGWINNELIYYQSEVSGYSHLYTHDLKTKKNTQLTEGKYEIHEAFLNKAKTQFFLSANKSHPGNRDFLMLDIKTKQIIPILTNDGNHMVSVSPDEKNLIVRYSSKNKPWELYSAKLEVNAKLKQITKSTTSEFENYSWRSPEVVSFKATDNTNLNARVYEPKEGTKNGAAVIFVHGAGYLQNAHNWWSGYHREYMFNNLLADKGFTVLDIDYRASKGYGRDFRTDIYRYMGGKDLSDQMDGRQYLINKYNIDPERIGIYGGSYGGFITLMALLTEPGKYKCGAAIRSVTDWAHYNNEYTSNILNTPDLDPEAFRVSSPIYYAQNLEDKLIMLHGMEDDNVQYQDVVRLTQRFIELGKKDWDLIGYPLEKHGFKEASSWTDEYRRILELFENELLIKK
jgi:acetyl esterase/lipase